MRAKASIGVFCYYICMKYSEALETGKTSLGVPDRIIETLLSKLYFFEDKVYKMYKWREAFYGDLSNLEFRRKYIKEDFLWNNLMSPDIYTEFLSLRVDNGQWVKTDESNAEDFCILMNVTEADRTFTALAEQQLLTKEIVKDIVEKMIPLARNITENRRGVLSQFLNMNLRETLIQEFEDLRNWAYMGHEFITHEEVDRIIDTTLEFGKNLEYFNNPEVRIEASIDGNPDNVLILNSGEVKFIDIMPPKENWRVADEFFNICRYGAEIGAFSDQSIADVLYETYFSIIGNQIPNEIRLIYEIRSALIQVPYRFVLGQPERAKKSLAFLYKQFGKIEAIK